MKKILFVIISVIAAVFVIVLAACNYLKVRHRDITGVTTLSKENTVIMNSPTGEEFVTGSGTLTVGEGEKIHAEYKLDAGSIDIAFHAGDDGLAVFDDTDMENLADEGDVFGKSGIEGSGTLDFEASPGEYTVFITIHKAVGSATLKTE